MSNQDDLEKKIDAFEARMDTKIAELEAQKDELIKENQEKLDRIKSLTEVVEEKRNELR